MKTKYILHGGSAHTIGVENDPFYAEILKDTPDNLKILLVYFANDPERNEERKKGNIEQFNRVKSDKRLEFEIADEEIFFDQIKNSDVIYIRGGSTPVLMKALSKFENLEKAFEGKIVSGESAGMNILAKYCYSKSGGGLTNGLGVLEVKTISHFDGANGLNEMDKVYPDLEKVYLPEFEYKVFYK